MLQCVALVGSVLQCVIVCCNVLHCGISENLPFSTTTLKHKNIHYVTLCNILQHTATHCNTLQHCTGPRFRHDVTPQHAQLLQRHSGGARRPMGVPTVCCALRRRCVPLTPPQRTTTHCNTLQHTAKHWLFQQSVVRCAGGVSP